MRVRLRAKARADLIQIFAYGVAEFGEAVAQQYKADIEAVLARLSDYPELGAPEPKIGTDIRSYPTREHRIYYRIIGNRISVGRVLHKRMDARHQM